VSAGEYVLHGLKLSYFTGKLEAYLRVKGVPHRFVGMDMADFRACARATGIAQMPQLETPDGGWLTDTTAILRRFEDEGAGPRLRPTDPAAGFLSLLLEDAFDEWLWRPALYYRWAFVEDARLMSRQIARTMLRDVPGPLWLRDRVIRARQRREFLARDGITPLTSPAIERLYPEVLAVLEAILASRPFLFGDRPCEADFGLFGPMFRHFFSDPTPGAILRETSPAVLAWTSRLWGTQPADLDGAADLAEAPADLDPLLALVARDHLPELAAHLEATLAGRPEARFQACGVDWRVPVSPYRAGCLLSLRQDFQALPEAARVAVRKRLGPAVAILEGTIPQLPARKSGRPLNRHLRA